MNLSPEEIAKAKEELKKMNHESYLRSLSEADRELLRKYPKHTLEAARMIDNTQLAPCVCGCRNAFDLIRLQETGNQFHISGDHT